MNKEELKLRIAKCILGPRFDLPTEAPYTLDQLREVRFERADRFERQDALNAAESILRDLIVYPRKQRISQMAFMKAEQKKRGRNKT